MIRNCLRTPLAFTAPAATVLALLALAPYAANGADEAALSAVPKKPVEAGDLAAQFLSFMQSNVDQQAKKAMELTESFLDAGRLAETRGIADFAQGWRKAAILYLVSGRAAGAGKKELSNEWFVLAEKGEQAMSVGGREQILVERIEALGARGELEKARKELGGLVSPVVKLDSEGRLIEFESIDKIEETAALFAAREKVAPAVRGRALLFAAEAIEKAGRQENAKAMATKSIEELCKGVDPVATIPTMHRAIAVLARLGDTEQAARWAEVCLGFAERTDVLAWWKTRDLRLAAASLIVAGKKQEAEKVLAGIPDCVQRLEPINFSRGGIGAAEAFLLAGKEPMFHKAAVHILKTSRQQPHPRSRAMAALDVLAGYVRNGLDIPAEVRSEFDESARSIEQETVKKPD